MSHLKVAYACNDGYVEQTGISIISLLENNRDFNQITIYLISKGISAENISVIEGICRDYNRNLVVIDFDSIAYDLNISDTGRHIETIYAKIFFSRIPDIDRLFYIDSDTVINGSLKNAWETDLSGCYMGMVETYTGGKAKVALGMPVSAPFYNDGVALVNVEYCRDNDLIGKCLAGINEYNGNPPVLSEGLLNKVCYGKIKPISPKFNMMAGLYHLLSLSPKYVNSKLSYSLAELEDSYRSPVIIHFLSGFYNRPWMKNCTHPLRNEFLRYKGISPWRDNPLRDGQLPMKLRLLGYLLNMIGPSNFDKVQKFLKK